jgi:hypothetical protein
MLSGSCQEAKRSDPERVVDLPKDYPRAILILLHIVHGAVSEVPQSLIVHDLWLVVRAADKWGLMRLLRPWATPWTADISPKTGLEAVMAVEAAWRLDTTISLSEAVMHLVNGLTITEAGSLAFEGQEFTIDPCMPWLSPSALKGKGFIVILPTGNSC